MIAEALAESVFDALDRKTGYITTRELRDEAGMPDRMTCPDCDLEQNARAVLFHIPEFEAGALVCEHCEQVMVVKLTPFGPDFTADAIEIVLQSGEVKWKI